jgi:hypothetical protein
MAEPKEVKTAQGAANFLYTDGTGKDHFGSTSTDWWWFGHYWLQAW